MLVPQGKSVAGGHAGQHAPPEHVLPTGHEVPVPQVRHTDPSAARTSGSGTPQATVLAPAQSPQQVRSVGCVVPGGLTQVPVAHIVPTPVHVRHTPPSVSRGLGTGTPQSTDASAGHAGQHAPAASQVAVPAQRVPVPVHGLLPMQVGGIAAPQSTMSGATQVAVHVHMPATHDRPPVHGPWQRPPQPSSAPHATPAGQEGTHSQRPASGLQASWGPGQAPSQKPPQPSSAPHAEPAGQCRTHTQRLPMQRSGGAQAGLHAHVSTHVPSLQTCPASHRTPKQGFAMQAPARQNCPSEHVTPSHAERGVHVKLHAASAPQLASQGTIGTHPPVAALQYSPAGQVMPSQATGRQPAKQRPSRHVWSAAHVTPSHGSTSDTHPAWQRSRPRRQGL